LASTARPGRFLPGDPRVEARPDHNSPIGLRGIIFPQLEPHRRFGAPYLVVPLPRLNHLLGTKRDQHPDDDDTYFAG